MMAKVPILSWCLIVFACTVYKTGGVPCSKCLDGKGHIVGCTLVGAQSYQLGESKNAVSLLQCFDKCLREKDCKFYAFDSKLTNSNELPCKLYSKLDPPVIESNLISQEGSTFSWMDHDSYTKWLSPTCQNNVCQAPPALPQGVCDKPLDITFLIDVYVDPDASLTRQKTFVVNVAKKFRLGLGHVIPSVVTYCLDADVFLGLKNFTTDAQFQTDVFSIAKSTRAGSRFDLALTAAADEIFNSQGGARPLTHRVVVLIANNNLPSGEETIQWWTIKDSLAKKCARTFVVTVGSSVDPEKFASGPDYIQKLDLFTELDANAENELAKRICSVLG